MIPEPLAVAQKIDALCGSIKTKAEGIAKFVDSEKLANAMANYDKSIELALIELEHQNVPVTIREKRAKGMCRDQLFELRSLEIKWKAMLAIMEATKARLNGQQSVNKHLDNT